MSSLGNGPPMHLVPEGYGSERIPEETEEGTYGLELPPDAKSMEETPALFLDPFDVHATDGKRDDPTGTNPPQTKKLAVMATIIVCIFVGILAAGLYNFLKVDDEPLASAQFDAETEVPIPASSAPTESPTFQPSISPTTLFPTESPTTSSPTESPTTSSPTENPTTSSPTESPTSSSPTESPTRALVTETPTVNGATFSPTFSPSSSPTTSPTPNPSLSPTPNPTLPPTFEDLTKSRLDCAAIKQAAADIGGNFGDNNFKVQEVDGEEYCGDTFGGIDPEKPNRNPWSIRIGRRDCPKFTYEEGIDICDTVGARWCRVDEFELGIAHGTGCGGDRELVYTSTDCEDINNGNLPGKVMFDVGLRATRAPFYECVSDLEVPSLARCCGDIEL